jgi:hypothetical protein
MLHPRHNSGKGATCGVEPVFTCLGCFSFTGQKEALINNCEPVLLALYSLYVTIYSLKLSLYVVSKVLVIANLYLLYHSLN